MMDESAVGRLTRRLRRGRFVGDEAGAEQLCRLVAHRTGAGLQHYIDNSETAKFLVGYFSRRGDTLSAISEMHFVDMAAVMQADGSASGQGLDFDLFCFRLDLESLVWDVAHYGNVEQDAINESASLIERMEELRSALSDQLWSKVRDRLANLSTLILPDADLAWNERRELIDRWKHETEAVIEQLHSSHAEPLATRPANEDAKVTINARMLDTMSKNPESHGWSIRAWKTHLGCKSISAIQKTVAWKSLQVMNEGAMMAKAKPKDRSQNGRTIHRNK